MSAPKAKLPGRTEAAAPGEAAFSVLEIAVALALAAVTASAALALVAGARSLALDAALSRGALALARGQLGAAVTNAAADYRAVSTTVPVAGGAYTTRLVVPTSSVSGCAETVSAQAMWGAEGGRLLTAEVNSTVTDTGLLFDRGGNCDLATPPPGWNPPTTFASSGVGSGTPTGVDSLGGFTYVGTNVSPFLFTARTASATLGQSNGLFLAYTNGFDARYPINDVAIARLPDGRTYAFAVRSTSTKQLLVIDVSDPDQPQPLGEYTLTGVAGSFPQGFRVAYFGGRVYAAARETAGPELHVFSAASPGALVELGSFELNETAEDFAVARRNGKILLFIAADSNLRELDVVDVTNPSAMGRVTVAVKNLPGNQDGASVYLLGSRLYFGRLNTATGPELYVFDAGNPVAGLPPVGQAEVGANVHGMAVSGSYAFLGTSKISDEFQIFRSDPYNLGKVNASGYGVPGLVPNGVKYQDGRAYVVNGSGLLKIVYTP